MKNSIIIALFTLLFGSHLAAQQFDMSAEIRPRFESKHGYKTLTVKDANPANFISQRTRLNFKYKMDKVKFGLSLQNVRVWGDVSTLSPVDRTSSFHEAWAQYSFNDHVAFKMGRQEIVYDDHRIFGSVGWAQQARSHDAFIVKHAKGNHKLDIGLALNADGQGGKDLLYSNAAGYKTFQYGWYHGDFNNLGISFLALNTGIEYIDSSTAQTVDYVQTIGPRLTYKMGKLSANAAAYFQTGKSSNKDVSALYYSANIAYKVMSNFKMGVGVEVLSGKDQNDTDKEIKSFAPLFGTNHKFNGWMDYFYVKNHGGSVGLVDISIPLIYTKNKFSAKLIPHLFSAAADVYKGTDVMDSNLGTEIDLNLGYKLSSSVKVNLGYSMMFATETMEVLKKTGDKDEANTWAWLMFTFKPNLLSVNKTK